MRRPLETKNRSYFPAQQGPLGFFIYGERMKVDSFIGALKPKTNDQLTVFIVESPQGERFVEVKLISHDQNILKADPSIVFTLSEVVGLIPMLQKAFRQYSSLESRDSANA